MALYRCGSSGGTTDFDTIFNGLPSQQTKTHTVNVGDILIVVSTNAHGNLTQSISGATVLETNNSGRGVITLCKATSSTLKVTQSDYQGYSNQIVIRLK